MRKSVFPNSPGRCYFFIYLFLFADTDPGIRTSAGKQANESEGESKIRANTLFALWTDFAREKKKSIRLKKIKLSMDSLQNHYISLHLMSVTRSISLKCRNEALIYILGNGVRVWIEEV